MKLRTLAHRLFLTSTTMLMTMLLVTSLAIAQESPIFLLIDEDSIDNGIKSIERISFRPPYCGNRNPAVCVNDDIADPGVRDFLFTRGNDITVVPFAGLVLPTGQVGDEGLFKFTRPDPQRSLQNGAEFTQQEFISANPGTIAADENNLDKIDGVVPLTRAEINALEGKTICAVVYDSDISVDVAERFGNLKGATLGRTAFVVRDVNPNPAGRSYLPLITVDLLSLDQAEQACSLEPPIVCPDPDRGVFEC